jgi:DUF4097 and DUF4098 domain-containing protein YvlB
MAALALVVGYGLAGSSLPAQQSGRHEIAGDRVAIYNLAGELRLEPGASSAVVVEATLGGDDAGQLRIETGAIRGWETLRVLYPADRISYRSHGSTELRVREDGTFGDWDHEDWHDRGAKVRISGSGGGLEAHADLTIQVPAGQTLNVYLAAGSVSARNVNGTLRLDTHSAPVTTSGTRGTLVVDVGSGRVTVSDTEGDVDLDTGSGSVEVTGVRGDVLRVDTGSGRVTASRVSVASLDIDTGSGSVEVSDAVARDVRVDTASGGVEVELAGELRNIEIDTGSGSVTVTVPERYGAEVEIDTGSGSIDIDLPLQLERWERTHVRGTIGDGAGRLVIDTGSGSVRIRKGA